MDRKSLFERCDEYDKAFALFAGLVGGVIDVLIVGNPATSIGGKMADKFVDECIVKFCNFVCDGQKSSDPVKAIGRLQDKYEINYDMAKSSDVGYMVNMGTKNHHLKSMGHSPDLIGLIFSILDQFQGTAHFIDNGQVVVVKTECQDLELYGKSLISKVFCGFVNWFGHLMSDIGGSYESRKKYGGRGSGVPLPFYNLLTLCDFGEIKTPKGKETISQVAVDIFTKGYDARAGIAMSTPLLITNLCINFYWFIKRRFYLKLPLRECIPSKAYGDLREMLMIADGTLCLIDGADALLQSKGNIVDFALRLNIVAWAHFCKLVFREICIRNQWGMAVLEVEFERIDFALEQHLRKLDNIDTTRLDQELQKAKVLNLHLFEMKTEEQVAGALYEAICVYDLDLPFHDHDSFNDFMNSDLELVL